MNATRHRLLAGEAHPWLVLLVLARLCASALAAGLVIGDGATVGEVPALLYGPLSTLALILVPRLRALPIVWALDCAIGLALILGSGDWRSPYYPLWLTTLALPAVQLSLRRACLLALAAPAVFLAVAFLGGPSPGQLNLVSTETLATHLVLPAGLVAGLAYAAQVLRDLRAARARGEQLAIERERHRIAWELHDSAKQRIHAAHLLVSSLQGRADMSVAPLVERAAAELELASAELDSSLAELRSPLDGRPLDEALRARAAELSTAGGPHVSVRGRAPALSPLAAAHVYRIGCEALTNALRHASAHEIEVTLEGDASHARLLVRDDGRGLPVRRRADAGGLVTMESRAASIGGRLELLAAEGGGTIVVLELPLHHDGRMA